MKRTSSVVTFGLTMAPEIVAVPSTGTVTGIGRPAKAKSVEAVVTKAGRPVSSRVVGSAGGAVDGGVGDGRIERDRVERAIVAGIDAEVQRLPGGDTDGGQVERLRRKVGRLGDGQREQLAAPTPRSWIEARTPSADASPAWVSAIWPVTLIVPVNGATQRRRLSTSGNAAWAAACCSGVGVVRPAVRVAAPLPSGVGLSGAKLGLPLASSRLNRTVPLLTRSGRPSPFTSAK